MELLKPLYSTAARTPKRDDETRAETQFRELIDLLHDAELTEDQKALVYDVAHTINAYDVLYYQCLGACKRMGFVYDESQRGGEFSQAFFWLQERGSEAHAAATADSKYTLLVGVEQRIEDLFRFYQENKNAS